MARRVALAVCLAFASVSFSLARAATAPSSPAAITLTPVCGVAQPASGAYAIGVDGVNFNPFTGILVTFDAGPGGRPESFQSSTDGFGHFNVIITPSPRPNGTHVVRADDFKQREATALFYIPCVTPSLTFQPNIGTPGFVTQAVGSGFPSSQLVHLVWDAVPPYPLGGGVMTSSTGTFSIPVLIFHHSPIGSYTLHATPGGATPYAEVDAQFLVVLGSAEPPLFTVRK